MLSHTMSLVEWAEETGSISLQRPARLPTYTFCSFVIYFLRNAKRLDQFGICEHFYESRVE